MARNHAVRSVLAATSGVPNSGPNKLGEPTWSDGEEDGFVIALQSDVELEPFVVSGRDQRATPFIVHSRQYGIIGVGLLLVGEVHPGDDAVEQATGEHGDVDVRGL